MPFADTATIAKMLATLGIRLGAHLPSRTPHDLLCALDSPVVAAIRPTFAQTARELAATGAQIVDSAPVGVDGTHHWLGEVGRFAGISNRRIAEAQNTFVAQIWQRLARCALDLRVTIHGGHGHELQLARLLVETGATVPIVSTGLKKPAWSSRDAAWLEANGTQVSFEASSRLARRVVENFAPKLAIGPAHVQTRARAMGIAGLDIGLLASCPVMGARGAGPLAEQVKKAAQA